MKCRKLDEFWEPGEVSLKMREKHKLVSLEATNDDISIIAAMSAAVFIGFYSALSNISGINPTLLLDLPVDVIKNPGISWLTGFICILILFSSMMIARLRLAIGKFSVEIAELHVETEKEDRRDDRSVQETRIPERAFVVGTRKNTKTNHIVSCKTCI